MKKILSILTLLVAFAMQGVANRTVYLSPGVWNVDGARFAVWAWPNTGEGQWVDALLAPNETNIYQVTLPDDIAKIIWVRMNGATTENNWDNKWNQTDDIVLGNENLYTITGWGEGNSPYSTGTYTYTIATINTVQLQGNFASTGTDWNAIDLSAVAGEENTWSGTLDLTDFTDDKEFKLVINGGDDGSKTYAGWIGTNTMTVDAPSGWVLATGESDNANCKLYNSTTGYKTYKITASWEPNSNYAAKWTLKIEGIDERHTYTVAGKPAALFGTEWDATLVDNDMVESATEPGVYTWTKNGVELGSGLAIEFKVCQDHALDIAYPSSNFVVNGGHGYTGAGTYNVTISFNSNTTIITPVFTLQAAQNAEITSVQLIGSTDASWTDETSKKFTLTATGVENEYSGEIDFSDVTTNYWFKLVVNDNNWIGWNALKLVDANNLLSAENGNDGDNFVLSNSNSGYKTYTVTAKWNPSPAATEGWTMTIAAKDFRDAYIHGEMFGGWENGKLMTKQENGLYTYVLEDFSAAATSYQYRMNTVEGNVFTGYTLPKDGNLTWECAEAGTYKLTFTANVTGEPIGDVAAYTLKLDAKKLTEPAVLPGTVIWEDATGVTPSWGEAFVTIASDKFASVKVGDKIHVAVQDVSAAA